MIRDTSTMDRPVDRRAARVRRRALLLAGGALLALLAALVVPGLRRWASSDTVVDAGRLRTAAVTRGDLVRDVDVQGSVVAAFRPNLTSPARGVARVEARAGQVVARGEVLVRVESPEVASRLEQERSTLLSLQADVARQRLATRQAALARRQQVRRLEVLLEAAKRAMERAERTRQMGLLNEVEYEEAEDDLAIARMQLELAREEGVLEADTLVFEVENRVSQMDRQRMVVADVERQLEELAVRSPVAGLVARVEVADRDSVTAGQPLVSVVDLSQLEVEVQVPESYAAEIAAGTPAVVRHDGRDWEGAVASISPEVEGSRVRGRVAFSGAVPPNLKQGQRVATRLLLDTRRDVLKVPRGPFLESGGGREAYVVDDGVAVRRRIEVGSISISEVEILSGLEEGEQIVLSDTAKLAGAERVLLRD
ncbi:MAG TPA: efflux RND transporter periplasmic adaptor subunit [Thermoanaerobaculia bacterium]|nr:efflux RND transporter periplasmic adaptor subunit [Thermoanaerobaculia bacterium]